MVLSILKHPFFSFITFAFWFVAVKSFLTPWLKRNSSIVSSSACVVSSFTFRFLNHLEFILMFSVRHRSDCIFFQIALLFSGLFLFTLFHFSYYCLSCLLLLNGRKWLFVTCYFKSKPSIIHII